MTSPRPTVRCVGDLMTDVVAHLPGPLAAGSDTPAAVRLTGGGSAANTACWLAVLGVDVVLVGRVGDDPAGRAAVDELRAAGVRTELEIDPERPTGACLVLVDPSGERTMVPDAGANAALSSVPLGRGEHLHVSGYALFHDDVRPVVLQAMADAVRAGGTVSLDVASSAPLQRFAVATVRDWCAGTTVLANLDEARALTGADDAATAATALADWGVAAVVKAGADGAWYAGGHGAVHVPVVDAVTDPIDTTGAGDAFAAGYLAARLHGATTGTAVTQGHVTASRVLRQVGARPRRPGGREAT